MNSSISRCMAIMERSAPSGETGNSDSIASPMYLSMMPPFDYNVIEDDHGYDKPEGYDCSIVSSEERNTLFTNDALKQRFIALWEKVAARYGNHDQIAFELLNEVVEQEAASSWNALIADAVRAIRKHAKTSPISYGGIQWNSARTLKLLDKPADKNIIYTFHFYEQLIFTHQKAHWVPNMIMDRDIKYPETMSSYIELSIFSDDDIGCAVWTYKEMDFGLIGEHYDSIREDLIKLYTR